MKKALLFLFFLFTILAFIIGVRYGQRVEKANKIIDFTLSLPPSPTLQPTLLPLEFKTLTHKQCSLQFVYPNFLNDEKNTSTSAILAKDSEKQIEIHCSKNDAIIEILEDKDIGSQELTFQGKKIQAKSILKNEVYIFRFIHPETGKTIYVSIVKSLFPLFEKSLEFVAL